MDYSFDPLLTPTFASNAEKQARFNPYMENGGSIVAIGGSGFAVIASETRLTAGFNIFSRECNKLFPLTPKTILGCAGCWCDILTFTELVRTRLKMYQFDHKEQMTTPAIAQLLVTMLYYKRFFPYYIANVVAGLEEGENGELEGVVFSYDPVGHMDKKKYVATGAAGPLLQPLLDNQVGHKNISIERTDALSKEEAISLVKDVFISAAEREINTGDGVHIMVLTKEGIETEQFALRKD
ncbi:unnamed protein product [Cyprideis torosa]|uniref:Uncharacterized protein n=1 Tax=Cyprideis torosa TaxID=163714 RepID=A0A7R8ZRB5_9CRUS|nr:unnamed protein product [Cyprideis torosa]CAG0892622.1 unnamed protein product [Cyprideis torosa]